MGSASLKDCSSGMLFFSEVEMWEKTSWIILFQFRSADTSRFHVVHAWKSQAGHCYKGKHETKKGCHIAHAQSMMLTE